MDIAPFLFSDAVNHFWKTRETQAAKQKLAGVADQGARSSVTGGKQMSGFIEEIFKLLITTGVDESEIFSSQKLELPGFYRPTKQWDLLVVRNKQLVAALELKSQVGPSFGNNFNNRTEEAVGSAVDLWTAYREGAFPVQPWLGYLFLLEDCPASRNTGKTVQEPHFKVFPEYKAAPYAKRYEILCRKLVRERQYNAACFIMADQYKAYTKENYWEPAPDLSVSLFIGQLLKHVAAGL